MRSIYSKRTLGLNFFFFGKKKPLRERGRCPLRSCEKVPPSREPNVRANSS